MTELINGILLSAKIKHITPAQPFTFHSESSSEQIIFDSISVLSLSVISGILISVLTTVSIIGALSLLIVLPILISGIINLILIIQ